MSLGVFVDVDNTITKGYIQEHYANALGVGQGYSEIENDFQSDRITSDEFGRQLIRLFATKGFSEDFAQRKYATIPRQDWAGRLLSLKVSKHLVSSGPCYYIRPLAKEFGIPEDNVLCSEYTFDKKTGVISDCDAVSEQRKSLFVQQRRSRHSFTIGIGDNLTKDGPFISNCTLGILTVQNPTYFSAQSHQTIVTLIEQMCELPSFRFRDRPEIFIASSSEAAPLAVRLQEALRDVCEPYVWNQQTFSQPGQTYIEALEREISVRDFVILLLTPDDVVTSRDVSQPAMRDNILFELGMGMGAIGRGRCFALVPHGQNVRIPSDLAGIILLEYDQDRAKDHFEVAFSSALRRVSDVVRQLGARA